MNKSKPLTTSDMEKYFIKRILLLYTTARKTHRFGIPGDQMKCHVFA